MLVQERVEGGGGRVGDGGSLGIIAHGRHLVKVTAIYLLSNGVCVCVLARTLLQHADVYNVAN